MRERLEDIEAESDPIARPAVSINLEPRDLSDIEPPTRQHVPADMSFPTHTAEDFLVLPQ